MKTNGFYCIANEGRYPPRVIHETQDVAIAEAERLTKEGHGPVAVAQIVAVVVPQTLTFISGADNCPDELPF